MAGARDHGIQVSYEVRRARGGGPGRRLLLAYVLMFWPLRLEGVSSVGQRAQETSPGVLGSPVSPLEPPHCV